DAAGQDQCRPQPVEPVERFQKRTLFETRYHYIMCGRHGITSRFIWLTTRPALPAQACAPIHAYTIEGRSGPDNGAILRYFFRSAGHRGCEPCCKRRLYGGEVALEGQPITVTGPGQ